MEKNLKSNFLMSLFFLIVFGIAFYLTHQFSTKARIFPSIIIIPGIVVSIGLIIFYLLELRKYKLSNENSAQTSSKQENNRENVQNKETKSFGIIIGYFAVAVLFGPLLGLPLVTFVHVILSGDRLRFPLALILSVLSLAVIFVFENYLHVILPNGLLI